MGQYANRIVMDIISDIIRKHKAKKEAGKADNTSGQKKDDRNTKKGTRM